MAMDGHRRHINGYRWSHADDNIIMLSSTLWTSKTCKVQPLVRWYLALHVVESSSEHVILPTYSWIVCNRLEFSYISFSAPLSPRLNAHNRRSKREVKITALWSLQPNRSDTWKTRQPECAAWRPSAGSCCCWWLRAQVRGDDNRPPWTRRGWDAWDCCSP